jgi:Ser/Thr protein kinase RdoA (MazF antagonist)
VLTRAEAVPLSPDAALPARDLLLDPVAAADRLAGLLGRSGPLEVTDARLVRAKYRIGESLRVVLRLTVEGAERTLVARAFRHGASAAAHVRALAIAVPTGDLHPVLHEADLDVVWWCVPNDRRLRALPALLTPTEDVAGLAGDGGRWVGSDLVELAPERSATARASDREGRTIGYAKAYAPGTVDLAALARRYDRAAAALAKVDGVRAPRALGWSDERDILMLEAMPGRRWDELPTSALGPALRRLGVAVATLHGVDPHGCGVGRFGRLQTGRVVHSAELVGRALPRHAARAGRLARALAAGAPADGPTVLLHGDCHPKNALAGADGLALIDLDQGALGAPAADLGSLLARLHHGAVLGEHDHADTPALAGHFLAGYAEVRSLPGDDDLRWHTAAALVAERAVRAVNRVHLPAIEAMGALLAQAERVLRHGALR